MDFLSLGSDCIVHVLSFVKMITDLRAILCCCRFIKESWDNYSAQLMWKPLYSTGLPHRPSVYHNVKLLDDQINTLDYLLNKSCRSSEDSNCLGSYVQLPMSAGKTIIAFVLCLERVKKLGGMSVAIFTRKVISTACEEVRKIYGQKPINNNYLATVDGVTFLFVDSYSQTKINVSNTVIVCTREYASYIFRNQSNVHTVTCDEIHTGSTSAKLIISSCVNMNPRPFFAAFTASSARTITRDSRRVVVIHGHDLEYYGHSSTISMEIPPVMYSIVSTEKDLFFAQPSQKSVELTEVLLNKKFQEWLARKRTTKLDKTTILAEWNDNVQSHVRSMSYIVEALTLMHGRVFIIVGQPASFCFNSTPSISHLTLIKFVSDGKTVTDLSSVTDEDRIAIGTTAAFSEGVNMTGFSNMILFQPGDCPEIARQCVGRLQRITNQTKMISVCIITNMPQVALASIVPRSITESYLEARGTKKLSVISQISPLVTPDLSMGEIIALCYKTNRKIVTNAWLASNGLVNFIVNGSEIKRVSKFKWHHTFSRTVAESLKFYVDPELVRVDYIPLIGQDRDCKLDHFIITVPKRKLVTDNDLTMIEKLHNTVTKSMDRYTLEQLREICSDLGIKKSGKLEEVARRILSIIE